MLSRTASRSSTTRARAGASPARAFIAGTINGISQTVENTIGDVSTSALGSVKSVIEMISVRGGLHPTEKPVALLAILVHTCCPPGGPVGDFCAGSAAGEAAMSTGRAYVGREIDPRMDAEAQPHTDNPNPQTALGSKFSAQYVAARALLNGPPHLADFEGDAFLDPELPGLMSNIRLVPFDHDPSGGDGEMNAEAIIHHPTARPRRNMSSAGSTEASETQ